MLVLKFLTSNLQEEMESAENELTELLCSIPNIANEDVPEGCDASDNVVVVEGGEKPNLPEDAFMSLGILQRKYKFN